MANSEQLGWLVLRGKRWYGYYRKQILDPETEDVRVSIVPVRLGLKSQRTRAAPMPHSEMRSPNRLANSVMVASSRTIELTRDAFIFPNADGGFMDTSNYRSRVLRPLADKLGIPKLNFQVIPRHDRQRSQTLVQ